MEKLISESALYEAIYKLPIRRERADGENYNYFVPIASIFEMLEKLPPANTSETPNSSDTISRQAAIEALDEIEAEVADGYGYQITHVYLLNFARPRRPAGMLFVRFGWLSVWLTHKREHSLLSFSPRTF